MKEITVRLDEPKYEQLPGMSDVFVLDPSIVADCSDAEKGLRIEPTGGPVVGCEIFMLTDGYSSSRLEVYPLDGENNPFFVEYDVGDQSIFEDDTLLDVLKRAFVKLRFYN